MITLVGHGYIGSAIAKSLRAQKIAFDWVSHSHGFSPSGPVINAAGFIGSPNVDECEKQKPLTIMGNVAWPLACESYAGAAPVIHISSGCVYQGGPFTEDDPPNFAGSFYSYSKVLQQEVLKPYLGKSYLLRMRMPFSTDEHPKNLLTKFRQYQTLVDGENSLSRVEDVVKVAIFFAQNLPEPGIYNLTNPGSVTNREIADLMGLKKQWVTQEAFLKTVKAPRSFCVLDSAKLQKVCPIDDVRTALNDCIVSETLAARAVA